MKKVNKIAILGSLISSFGLPALIAGAQTTTTTPGVPSAGVGPEEALLNILLLAISAVAAVVGGYYLSRTKEGA